MEFWCGEILRDVRSTILTTPQNEYIYFHIKPITFLLHTRNKLKITKSLIICIIYFHEHNGKNNILIKQTKNDIQNEYKRSVATSVSKAFT